MYEAGASKWPRLDKTIRTEQLGIVKKGLNDWLNFGQFLFCQNSHKVILYESKHFKKICD